MLRKPRVNNQIRISPIRLIDEKGRNLGIVETYQALDMAKERGLDLIEIAPMARPPVCRIIDFGKYQYQKNRQEKTQKTKQKRIEIKGIRISLRTGQHDLETKVKQTEKFLQKGDKIRIEIILKGREKSFQFQNLAKEKLQEFIKLIPIEVIIEREIKREGRGFNIIIAKRENK
ncbi:MAG: translation initiation factor IF-3 [Candidatus Portnoybacteria bacterium RIFCSPHIGHO2_02_FULL_40_23]|uniref:Translation initiation factor IF-3 n=2 Tax=Candidatus Portnoyibacteriota TaxID=1817913 RepID=A0A1G2FD06_9BACT|nr:MAG: translation initiation factor IF-3 [Candidatus Portnoybacteria bacterium RIFCSPHIGHO2_01_FULL_40_12b]OGZ36343.1 MAG: translation initiation factor IF-3 [Candidatus Portnoybacteria bacterium RIFCSPHIGHO2_02_FULL_40_23]OGZ40311.1 MAG: translation initiation factor IF-3 [Candidatus Portnoybacteria bacterium RIFCSPLOWO2_02_FULL_40_15]